MKICGLSGIYFVTITWTQKGLWFSCTFPQRRCSTSWLVVQQEVWVTVENPVDMRQNVVCRTTEKDLNVTSVLIRPVIFHQPWCSVSRAWSKQRADWMGVCDLDGREAGRDHVGEIYDAIGCRHCCRSLDDDCATCRWPCAIIGTANAFQLLEGGNSNSPCQLRRRTSKLRRIWCECY